MKKLILFSLSLLLFLALSSFGLHKFYVSLYQVNYVPQKKMLQITARLFVDDLNYSIGKKYQKKINLGSEKETEQEVVLFKKYFNEKLYIRVNGKIEPFYFISKEMEGDVLICYFGIKEIEKIRELEVYNSLLTETYLEQQNIMHFNVMGIKNTLLLTESSAKGVVVY